MADHQKCKSGDLEITFIAHFGKESGCWNKLNTLSIRRKNTKVIEFSIRVNSLKHSIGLFDVKTDWADKRNDEFYCVTNDIHRFLKNLEKSLRNEERTMKKCLTLLRKRKYAKISLLLEKVFRQLLSFMQKTQWTCKKGVKLKKKVVSLLSLGRKRSNSSKQETVEPIDTSIDNCKLYFVEQARKDVKIGNLNQKHQHKKCSSIMKNTEEELMDVNKENFDVSEKCINSRQKQ